MASSKEMVDYVCDQLSGAGKSGPNGCSASGVCTAAGFISAAFRQPAVYQTHGHQWDLLARPEPAAPYEGAKPCWRIEDLEDRKTLASLVERTCAELKQGGKKTERAGGVSMDGERLLVVVDYQKILWTGRWALPVRRIWICALRLKSNAITMPEMWLCSLTTRTGKNYLTTQEGRKLPCGALHLRHTGLGTVRRNGQAAKGRRPVFPETHISVAGTGGLSG